MRSDSASLVEEIWVGSGGDGEDDAEGRKVGSDPRYAEIHAARLGESSKRLDASDDISWSSDCARGSGGRSGSSDGEVVRVGAAPVPAVALAGRLPCGGEEVGFKRDGLGGSDGDEAVSPNLAGEGMCDCIITAAAEGAGAGIGRETTRSCLRTTLSQQSTSWAHHLGRPFCYIIGPCVRWPNVPALKALAHRPHTPAAASSPKLWRETSSTPPPLPAQSSRSEQAMDGGSSSPASPPPTAGPSAAEMEEYQNWKKNAAVLYDVVLSHPLEWPSLTVQWLPSESSTRSHRLVVGTHTSDEAPNNLMVLDAVLPLPPRLAATVAASGGTLPAPSVSVSRVAPHRGEVNRARCMPQRPFTVATKTCLDEVHVYHLGDGDGSGKSGADVVLRGHDAEGYGLAWSPMKEGWLLSGSYDKKICLWDLASGNGAPILDAQQVFEVMPHLTLLFLFLQFMCHFIQHHCIFGSDTCNHFITVRLDEWINLICTTDTGSFVCIILALEQ